MTASTLARRAWNSSRSARLPIAPERPPMLARPSTVLVMFRTTYGRLARPRARSAKSIALTISCAPASALGGSSRLNKCTALASDGCPGAPCVCGDELIVPP